MTVRAAWLLPGGTQLGQTREDTRLTPLGTFAPESELRTRDGVIAGGNPFAATGAGAMSLQIGVGRALVQGTVAQGAYPVAVTAPETVTFDDGDPQYDRIDSVILHVYDQLFDSSGQNLVQVEILTGVPAASPVERTLPAACLRLWNVTVPAGASAGVGGISWGAALSDRRRLTSAYGGILPRGYGLTFDGAYDGQYRDNGTALERWNAAGAVWEVYRPPVDTVGWTAPALAAGYTNNGNNQGTLRYRRITIDGIPHMQWRGGVSWTTSGSPPGSGIPLAGPVPAAYRPAVHTSTSMAAGGVPMKCDFQTSGQVHFITNPSVTTWASFAGILYPLDS
ncbi:hypothetical protein ACFZB5_33405 [Streptomyces nodosus]|uniref:hypothetical protein n=1 Tax=Streptomyces nodosus TaxID=40318 RepID=UPI0036E91DBF